MQSNELFTQRHTILLDGGMGTMLQAAGLKLGARPEELNITAPETIQRIHGMYAAAGSRIINTNTFGASGHKLAKSPYTVEEVIAAGVACCKKACAPYGALTALDIGPLGELLEPNGTLPFETAVAEFARIVRAGAAAGADLVMVETFTDLYELKAALLAVKENCKLPVLASMSFEARGRTFTGCTVESFAATARGLGADALGINCSLGPQEIFPMAKRLAESLPGDFPVFVKPNAGLPRADGSGYDITPELYARQMEPYRELGLFAAGGCCGTTPDFIRLLNDVFRDCVPGRAAHTTPSVICSPVECVTVDGVTVVGERINPTGKKRFQQALRQGDMDYVLEQAVSQAEAGAQILDVNVGTPEVDEPAMMEQVVKTLQSVVSQPLQLDSTNFEALERGLRVYNGKPIVNSVNGAPAVLEHVLPLCKKYGAAVIGLTVDGAGVPSGAGERVAIARRIRDAALDAGIPLEDIYIDCLALTASAQQEDALAAVEALERCKKELGVRTILGVSNISFGLPCRAYLNTIFLTLAIHGAGSGHYGSGQSGDDGGHLRLQRAVGAGQAVRRLCGAVRGPRAHGHGAGQDHAERLHRRRHLRRQRQRRLRAADEGGGAGAEGRGGSRRPDAAAGEGAAGAGGRGADSGVGRGGRQVRKRHAVPAPAAAGRQRRPERL